jgi:hypothetical protein
MGKRASVGGEGAKKRLTQASANRLVTDVSFIIERRQHEQQEAEIKKICEQLRENPRLIPGVITLIECGGAGYEDNFPRGIGTQGANNYLPHTKHQSMSTNSFGVWFVASCVALRPHKKLHEQSRIQSPGGSPTSPSGTATGSWTRSASTAP